MSISITMSTICLTMALKYPFFRDYGLDCRISTERDEDLLDKLDDLDQRASERDVQVSHALFLSRSSHTTYTL